MKELSPFLFQLSLGCDRFVYDRKNSLIRHSKLVIPMVHYLEQQLFKLGVIVGRRKIAIFIFDVIRWAIQDSVVGGLEHRDVVVGITHCDDLVVQAFECLRNHFFAVLLAQVISTDGAVAVNGKRVAE